MTKLVSLFLIILMGSPAAMAGYNRSGGTRQRTCYKEVYREEYIPGTREHPGRVRRWTQIKEIPCKGNRRGNRGNHHGHNHHGHNHPTSRHVDDNSCVEGSILGGIAGGAAGAALSRGDGMWIGIPLGIVGGALVGCQIDGG